MKLWTYSQAVTKIQADLDLEDETFISPNEMIGYFNEALEFAENEIQATNQDYLITKAFIPIVQGQQQFPLPRNILANKIRNIYYLNGAINYTVDQFRRWHKGKYIEMTDAFAKSAWYMYTLINDIPGQAMIEIHPPCRESAIMPPQSGAFTPMIMRYIRNCARVPLLGEFCNPEVCATTQVDLVNNQIATNSGSPTVLGIEAQGKVGCYPGSRAYVTGDAVQILPLFNGTIPAPLSLGTTYYVIALGSGNIRLATSKQNALNNVPLTLSSVGTIGFVIQVAATQTDVNNTILDIPEFTSFLIQFVKCRAMDKETDPRFDKNFAILEKLQQEMVDTLTDAIQDDDNEIQGDFSYYNYLS